MVGAGRQWLEQVDHVWSRWVVVRAGTQWLEHLGSGWSRYTVVGAGTVGSGCSR